jgi:hypothetical protein
MWSVFEWYAGSGRQIAPDGGPWREPDPASREKTLDSDRDEENSTEHRDGGG